MSIINKQKPEKEDRVYGSLDVHSVFDTIQGEGPFNGMPATFLRLAGCNLQCEACDTEYTEGRKRMYLADVIDVIETLPKRTLVVMTGGEPFRQSLRVMIMLLQQTGRHTQIETNGLYDPGLDLDDLRADTMPTVVCSPKTPLLHQNIWDRVHSLKYVVKAGEIGKDGLPLRSVGLQYGAPARPPGDWDGDIYVQPLDEQDDELNRLNAEAAAESVRAHGYRLCLQMHKIVGLD